MSLSRNIMIPTIATVILFCSSDPVIPNPKIALMELNKMLPQDQPA